MSLKNTNIFKVSEAYEEVEVEVGETEEMAVITKKQGTLSQQGMLKAKKARKMRIFHYLNLVQINAVL